MMLQDLPPAIVPIALSVIARLLVVSLLALLSSRR